MLTKSKGYTKIIFLLLLGSICCLNVTKSSTHRSIACSTLSIDEIYSLTDFTMFSFGTAHPSLNIDVTSSSVLLEHTKPFASDSKQQYKAEFNIGRNATFGDFDVWINTTFDLTPHYWGELLIFIGSSYQPDNVVSADLKLGYVQICDPWWAADGVFGAGNGHIVNDADNETTMPNPSIYNSATFHLTRNSSAVLCEVIQDSITKVSYSWLEEEILPCNYIRIELQYYSEVSAFSFTLSDLNAVLNVTGEINSAPIPTTDVPSSIQLPSLGYLGVLFILGTITRISIVVRRKKTFN